MTSSTSSWGTEFTCLVFMYVRHFHTLSFSQVNPRFVSLDLCFYRSTTKWIKSPSRKWTAWPTDLTVLSSGQISVFGVAAIFSLSVYVYPVVYVSVVGWSWTWITFWRCCGNTCPSFAFIPRKEEVHGYTFYDNYLPLSHAHKCISSNLFQLKYFLFLSERPDFNDPIIMRRGSNVEHVVRKTSKSLLKWLKQNLLKN